MGLFTDKPQNGMLPLMMGIGILQNNQARPYTQGPPTLGAGLAQGAQLYLQQMAAQQKATQDKQKLEADQAYRQQMLDYQKQRVQAAAGKLSPFGNKLDAMGRPIFTSPAGGTFVGGALGVEPYDPELAPQAGMEVRTRDLSGSTQQDWLWDKQNNEWVRAIGAAHPRWKEGTDAGSDVSRVAHPRTVSIPGVGLTTLFNRGEDWYYHDEKGQEKKLDRRYIPASESRLQDAEKRRDRDQLIAQAREQRLRAETVLEATRMSRMVKAPLANQLMSWTLYQNQLERVSKGEARQAVGDQALMVAYAQSQDPGRNVTTKDQDYIISETRNLAEAIGMTVGGLAWGTELPDELRNEMNTRVYEAASYAREARFNVDYSLGINLAVEGKIHTWTPPDAKKAEVDGRVYWVYPDGEEYDVTELYQGQ